MVYPRSPSNPRRRVCPPDTCPCLSPHCLEPHEMQQRPARLYASGDTAFLSKRQNMPGRDSLEKKPPLQTIKLFRTDFSHQQDRPHQFGLLKISPNGGAKNTVGKDCPIQERMTKILSLQAPTQMTELTPTQMQAFLQLKSSYFQDQPTLSSGRTFVLQVAKTQDPQNRPSSILQEELSNISRVQNIDQHWNIKPNHRNHSKHLNILDGEKVETKKRYAKKLKGHLVNDKKTLHLDQINQQDRRHRASDKSKQTDVLLLCTGGDGKSFEDAVITEEGFQGGLPPVPSHAAASLPITSAVKDRDGQRKWTLAERLTKVMKFIGKGKPFKLQELQHKSFIRLQQETSERDIDNTDDLILRSIAD